MTVAIDYETDLMDDTTGLAPRPVCLSWCNNGIASGIIVDIDEMEAYWNKILDNGDYIVAHNATFEVCVTHKHFPNLRDKLKAAIRKQKFVCTKLFEQHINATRASAGFVTKCEKALNKVNLASLVEHYFHVDISETKTDPNAWRLRYSELRGVPLAKWPKEAVDYSIQDSVWAFKVYKEQIKTHLKSVMEATECELWLNLMGNEGLIIDVDRVNEIEREVYAEIEPARKFLIEAGICYFNKKGEFCKKDKALKEHVMQIIEAPRVSAKGNIIIKSEMLELYASLTNDKILESYMKVKSLEKVLTTYTSRMKSPLVRTSYSAGKETNRTSTSVKGPYLMLGIQQMPRQMNE